MNSGHLAAKSISLIDRGMKKANKCAQRNVILKGRIDSLENVPEMYEVSKESGLGEVEDGDELEFFDADIGKKPWRLHSRMR